MIGNTLFDEKSNNCEVLDATGEDKKEYKFGRTIPAWIGIKYVSTLHNLNEQYRETDEDERKLEYGRRKGQMNNKAVTLIKEYDDCTQYFHWTLDCKVYIRTYNRHFTQLQGVV